MEKSLANLGDFFPDQRLECTTPGCNNLCLGENTGQNESTADPDNQLPEPVCDRCRTLFAELTDQDLPCVRPDCQNRWKWSRLEQLNNRRQAEAKGLHSTEPPPGLCADCEKMAEKLGDLDVKCSIEACNNTWRWGAKERLCSQNSTPEDKMCRRCEQTLAGLQDRNIRCSSDGCSNSWLWTAMEQLEEMIKGDTRRPPPRKMCGQCREKLAGLEDRHIPCRVNGCKRTWLLTAEAQLRHLLIHGSEHDPAEGVKRMCEPCYEFIQNAKPRQIPCRIRGCRNTWTFSPSRQLHDFANERKRPPPLLCEKCREKLEQLQPLTKPCATPGCQGSWIWAPEEQLRYLMRKTDRYRSEKEPEKRCADCEDFLHSHAPKTLFCNECGCPVSWAPYEQLLCSYGTFTKPTRCSNCSTRTVAEKQTSPEDFIQHAELREFPVPPRGPWQKNRLIAHRPPRLDHNTLKRLREADVRIVAFGDETTVSSKPGWPRLLEKILNQKLRDWATTVAVANTGMPECNSQLATLRLERDVKPFNPHLIIASFVFADAYTEFDPRQEDGCALTAPENEMIEAEQELLRQLLGISSKLLYWLPNPIFPYDQITDQDGEAKRRWAGTLESRYRHARARASRLCQDKQVPVVDLGSRFEVNGRRSATKWMDGPFSPNEAGTRNIANWMAEAVLNHKLVPLE